MRKDKPKVIVEAFKPRRTPGGAKAVDGAAHTPNPPSPTQRA